MAALRYNERAWAIDLISAINKIAQNTTRPVVRAGGESTLPDGNLRNSLYPDVLLYGDENGVRVRHGWELKFPDTPINDSELYNNAVEKAQRLGVNSFILWNVDQAVLYVQAPSAGHFSILKQWPSLGIKTRQEVDSNKDRWIELLRQIIEDVNDFFDNGNLKSSSPSEILGDTFFAKFIEEYWAVSSDSIKKAVIKSAKLEAGITEWWKCSASEHESKPVDYRVLSTAVLTNWLNRFLFCHYLKRFHSAAKDVESITSVTTLQEAVKIFDGITSRCDFMQVFQTEIASENIGNEAWLGLCHLNHFLIDLKLEEVSQESLQTVLESALDNSKRKSAGQYPTPPELARLLVGLAIEDRSDHVIDPCCGTGTIPRAVYELKTSKGMTQGAALSTVWASDKFQFPLQLCTLSLADPSAMGEIVRVFKRDVFDLSPRQNISFTDPNTGAKKDEELPLVGAIVSNLPFVRFEVLSHYHSDDLPSLERNPNSALISGKSDLWAHIIVSLNDLLKEHGRIGVIVSNSWLSADWGKSFRVIMSEMYHVRAVVTSGAGKWFDNASVVTNIIVLEKKLPSDAVCKTKFVTTLIPLKTQDDNQIDTVAAKILSSENDTSDQNVRVNVYASEERERIEKICIGWSCFFTDVRWVNDFEPKLIKASSLFDISRGERRGWDKMFYPSAGHEIESEYISPVLENTRNVQGYVADTDSQAFCCSKTISELTTKGHIGALGWIRKFEGGLNSVGKPLTEALARSNHFWYEMKPDSLADFVTGMNPEDRIFIAKMRQRAFVNQRLIRFTRNNDEIDMDLAHALLNSTFGLFMIEVAGFGRGLGALDLNATKLKNGFYMFNPALLDSKGQQEIVRAFDRVRGRDVYSLEQELQQNDRFQLDVAVLNAYGMGEYLVRIKTALIDLYRIRKSVKV